MSHDAARTAFRRMVDATDAGDSAAFLACFAEDAVLDDWGRTYQGHDAIADWNRSDNIGVCTRFRIVGEDDSGPAYVADVQVSGEGFNGDSRFEVEESDGLISRLTIRA
jgi:hypothetical protein